MSDKALQRLLRSGLDGSPALEDAVMSALTPASDLGLLLRHALVGPVDLADEVMEQLRPEVGQSLRMALQEPVDLGMMDALPSFEKMAEDSELSSISQLLSAGLSEEVDLSGDIFAALEEEPRLGALLRQELSGEDLSEGIFSALEDDGQVGMLLRDHLGGADLEEAVLSSLDDAPGEALRASLQGVVSLEDGVMDALAADERLGTILREALNERVDVSAAVMAVAVPESGRVSTVPLWVQAREAPRGENSRPRSERRATSGGRSPAPPSTKPARSPAWRVVPAVAVFAALVFAILRLTANDVSPSAMAPFVLQAHNEAEVEDLTTSSTASAQVMKFEDDGPTFILVDEGETSNTTVPL